MNSQDTEGARFRLRRDMWDEIACRWRLAPQQKRVAEHLLRLHNDRVIARKMQLQLTTVRTYLTRLFLASNSKNRLHFMHQVWSTEKNILAERGLYIEDDAAAPVQIARTEQFASRD